MPIGPIGQPPIDRTLADNHTADASRKPFPSPNAPPSSEPQTATPVNIATQLVQNARAGNSASTGPALGDLINAQMAQMGLPALPAEQQQRLIAQLADDPVVKGLIG